MTLNELVAFQKHWIEFSEKNYDVDMTKDKQILVILQEKQEREKGCEYCNVKHLNFKVGTALPKTPFCPNCGRKLGENNG
jgi:hypothetical protein